MILQWIVSASLVGVLLAVAGTCLAHFAPRLGLPRRWLWLVVMTLSLGLPVAFALRSHPAPAIQLPNSSNAADAGGAVKLGNAPLPKSGNSGNSDLVVLLAWAAVSALLAAMFTLSHRRTLVEMRTWQRRDLLGSTVTVSPDFGPAAVGLIHPDVVVPEWIFELPVAEQRLVLDHEQQHIMAGDHLVLLAGVAAAVLMPWNLGLWWQLRRLRVGMELDCDARVAPTPRERPRYAELLLKARSERATGRMALALAPAPSALAERLLELLDRARPTRRQVAAWSASALACVVVVSKVPVPDLSPLLTRPVAPMVPTPVSTVPDVIAVEPGAVRSALTRKSEADGPKVPAHARLSSMHSTASAQPDSEPAPRYDRLIPYVPDTGHAQGARGGRSGGVGIMVGGAAGARRTGSDSSAGDGGDFQAKFGPGYSTQGTPGGGRAGRIGTATPLDSVTAKKQPALPDSLLGPRP